MKRTKDNEEMQTAYSFWHNKPLLLSIEEIDRPFMVLDDFFDFCSLAEARSRLHEWLFASFHEGEAEFTFFKGQIEKLVEAAWIIFQAKGRHFENAINSEENFRPSNLSGSGIPIHELNKLFSRVQLNELKSELQLWCEVALCSEGNAYNTGALRNNLIRLCHAFSALIGALYFFQRDKNETNTGRRAPKRSVHYMDESNSMQIALAGQGAAEPMEIIREFCREFDKNYVREELWNMLDSVMVAERKRASTKSVPLVYECFLSIVESAYRLSQAKKRKRGK